MKNLVVRRLKISDIPEAIEVEKASWQPHCSDDYVFKPAHLESQIATFPEGVLGAFIKNELMGFVVTEIVSSRFIFATKTWDDMTDRGYIKATHHLDGDTMYGVDLSVHPKAPSRLSQQLLVGEAQLAIRMSLRRIVLGGRIPSYYKYADKMSAEQYILAHTSSGKSLDPEIGFYAESGLSIIGILPEYMPDPESMNYGVLLEWRNPFYHITRHFKSLAPIFSSIIKYAV
jgi:hypothetical protein